MLRAEGETRRATWQEKKAGKLISKESPPVSCSGRGADVPSVDVQAFMKARGVDTESEGRRGG